MSQTNNSHKKRQTRSNYDQNDGKPGVVYILRNDAFKENWLKIGQSKRSGQKRAEEINREAGTGLPKHHVCVFEYHTADCGRAEKAIHKRLASYRKGKQEYFEVDITLAKEVIIQECSRFNIDAHQQAGKDAANKLETQCQEKIPQAERIQQKREYTENNCFGNVLPAQKRWKEQQDAEKLEVQHQDRGIKKQWETPRAKEFAKKFQQAKQIEQEQENAKKLEVQRQEINPQEQRMRQEQNRSDSERAENLLKRQAQEEAERLEVERQDSGLKNLRETPRARAFAKKFQQAKQIGQEQENAKKLEVQRQEINLQEQRMQQKANHATENLRRRPAHEEVERLAKEKARRTQEEEFNRMELERFKKLAEDKFQRDAALAKKNEAERLEKEKARRSLEEQCNRMEFERIRNLAEDKSRRDAALAEKIEQANRIKQAQDEAEKLTLERATTHSYDLPIRETAPSESSWKNYANGEAVIQPKLNTTRESKLFSTDLIITCTAILLITFYFIADKSKEELPPQAYSTINKPSKSPEEILLEKKKNSFN